MTCRRFRTKRRNKFACSKISSSMSAMLFALIFPRAQRASTYDISAERNVWLLLLMSALRSSAIVCDYMETGLFAIVCDPRSFAIIWKPAFMRCFFTDELSLARCSFVRSCRNRVVLPTSETRHVGSTTCRASDVGSTTTITLKSK